MISRRTLVQRAALGAVGSAAIAELLAAQPASASDLGHATAAPGSGAFVSSDAGLHLLRRATFGLTPKLVAQMASQGPTAWLNEQLAPSSINDDKLDVMIADRFPGVNWSIGQAIANLEEFSWDLMFDLGVSSIARAAWSRRQLFEVMVDFWTNHLNVTNPFDDGWCVRHDYDRVVLRANALGKFSDMLKASATHPAMMLYLNNAESTKDNPNENYGRELLELHTIGVDGGYDEVDMRQSTMVMTGFGVNWDTYTFKYHQSDHFTGPVSVMGWSSSNATAAGGYAVGLSYVDYLAHHPSTALHIATKLVRRFVSDTPQPALAAALAQTYLANDTAIQPVLRQLFASTEFAGLIGSKVRRPLEDLVATMRTLNMKWDISGSKGMRGLYWMSEDLGNAPAGWHQPNGYPDTADAWASAGGTLGRWNTHISLAAHWWPKDLVLPPLRKLLPQTLPATYGAFVDALALRLVNQPLDPSHRAAVLAFVEHKSTDVLKKTDAVLAWRFPYVVALILDTPYHWMR